MTRQLSFFPEDARRAEPPPRRSASLGMQYLRTSTLFRATAGVVLQVGPARLRLFASDEATRLADALRRRNPFSRSARERDFYTAKASALADETVTEIVSVRSMTPGEARGMAERAERLALAATALFIERDRLHRVLGVSERAAGVRDLFIAGANNLSARTRAPRPHGWVEVDASFAKRFVQYGFEKTAETIVGGTGYVGGRVEKALRWLMECRLEHSAEAAYVKAVIGFETLFVLDQNEPLRQTIGDRTAFLLGRDSAQREAISKIAQALYQTRSAIVHGGRTTSHAAAEQLPTAERLLVLAAQGLAFQSHLKSADDQRRWFNEMKWSLRTEPPELPFGTGALSRLVAGEQRRKNTK